MNRISVRTVVQEWTVTRMANLTIPIQINLPEDWVEQVVNRLKNDPEAEWVQIVRCKDCKWFGDIGCAIEVVDDSDRPTEDDFCSFAERRSDE